ncbi:MAG: hypothetical protein ACFE9I_08575 [Candidatus Hermodarchaeota archaeon]
MRSQIGIMCYTTVLVKLIQPTAEAGHTSIGKVSSASSAETLEALNVEIVEIFSRRIKNM